MATVINVQELGNSLSVLFSDGSHVVCYSQGNNLYIPIIQNQIKYINLLGNEIQIKYPDNSTDIGYNTGRNYFIVDGGTDIPPIANGLIDNILPGHHITNPGGTVDSGWAWHVNTANNRGGDDLSYNFQTFKAPGNGIVSHFNVTGVGMVVKLILDTPAIRTLPQLSHDANGPMTAIWFEHCSAAIDGHHNQGDIIGTSGDGYGAYAPHLHVHGLIGNGNSASSSNRCCFWKFL